MDPFVAVILILFIICLAFQFVMAIEKNCIKLAIMFGAEILMFAYIAKTLM